MRRSTWFRPTHPASKQLAYDEEVRQLAIEVFDAMPYELRSEIEGFLHGVYHPPTLRCAGAARPA
jgi:hypothetical protein